MSSPLLRPSLVATMILASPPAQAAERPSSTSWTTIAAPVETVGTCATDEISEIRACYVVRCEPRAGLVFAMQEPDLGQEGVRRVRITIGKRRQDFAVHGTAPNERWARMRDVPALLPLLTSGATWANIETTQAKMMFGTGFDLTGAKARIEALAGRCRT